MGNSCEIIRTPEYVPSFSSHACTYSTILGMASMSNDSSGGRRIYFRRSIHVYIYTYSRSRNRRCRLKPLEDLHSSLTIRQWLNIALLPKPPRISCRRNSPFICGTQQFAYFGRPIQHIVVTRMFAIYQTTKGAPRLRKLNLPAKQTGRTVKTATLQKVELGPNLGRIRLSAQQATKAPGWRSGSTTTSRTWGAASPYVAFTWKTLDCTSSRQDGAQRSEQL